MTRTGWLIRPPELVPYDEQPVIICCRSGVTSQQAAEAMAAAGAPAFYELGGGYMAW